MTATLVRVIHASRDFKLSVVTVDIASPDAIYALVNGCREIFSLDGFGFPISVCGAGEGPIVVLRNGPDGTWVDFEDGMLDRLLASYAEALKRHREALS